MTNIPIVNPQKFVNDYFDHVLIEQDGFDVNKLIINDAACFFLISDIEAGKKYINFPKQSIKTTFYEIIFITEGQNKVTDNLNEYVQNKNQIRFITPGKITSVLELSQNIKGYYILFDKLFIDTHSGVSNLLSSFRFFDIDALSILTLTDVQAEFFKVVFEKIKFDFENNYEVLRAVTCHYLISILRECNLFYEKLEVENSKLTSAERITQNFLGLVGKYYLSKRAISCYANLLNITPKHLAKSVKQATGKTPMLFIQEMLILEIKVLLKETNQSVSEIAYQLGFEDAAYFNRFFKHHTGLTPLMYRKSNSI